jgi:signal-transduction protein with cAMP-binding, CBS, and nucleotidyltransferase domain
MENLDKELKLENQTHFLREVPFFKTLSAKELSFLASYLKMENFDAGQTILEQGDRGSHLYLIKSGVVSATVKLPGDMAKEVAQLHAGQLFGEVSFLATTLITATITAKGPCECLVFYHDVLEMLRVGFPDTAFKIERQIALQSIERIVPTFNNIHHILQTIPEDLQPHSEHALQLPNPAAGYKEISIQTLKTDHFTHIGLFKLLNEQQIAALLPYLTVRSYDRGYRLLKNEADTLKLEWIYLGAAMLFIKNDCVLQKSIAVSGIGELLIQNFLFENFHKVAEYVTCEESIIVELNWEGYEALKKQQPAIFYVISQNLHTTIVDSLYIVNREFVRINSEYKALLR